MKRILLGAAALALAPFAAAGDINVSYSEDFTETLEEDYGTREGEHLAEEIQDDLIRAFEKAGISPARVDVVILDAKPNRPTFKQLGDEPGLDFSRSIGIGGMKMTAIAYDESDTAIGELEYGWFENDLRDVIGATTWSDAQRASRFFARKFVKEIEG